MYQNRRQHLRAGLIAAPDWRRFKGSSGTNTVETQSGPPASVLANYNNAYSQAQNVASQPYQPYTGSLVAGFTPMQQAGFNAVNTAANAGQPFINQASQDVTNSTNSLNAQNFGNTVAQYQSPYTDSVVKATEAQQQNQNAIQQNQLAGNAASAGAFGGDRQAVAQAVLGGQQATANNATIANLYNTGFQNATSAAQSNAWLNSQGAFSMGNLGNEAQQQGLTAANAMLTAGGTQQQQAQNELNIPYESYQAAQAYPFQTTGWLGNMAEGTGSLSGGTSSTTSPGASTASQVAGLGIAGLGAYGLYNNLTSGPTSSANAASINAMESAAPTADMSSVGSWGGDVYGSRGGRVPGLAAGGVPEAPNLDVSTIPAGSSGSAPLIDSSTGSTSTAGSSGGNELGGIAGGAMSGASMGSMFGPWGAAIGGVLGGILGGVSNSKARGGRVPGFANGGTPMDPMGFAGGVPDISITLVPTDTTQKQHQSTIPRAPNPVQDTGLSSLNQDLQLANGMSKIGGLFNQNAGQSIGESQGGRIGGFAPPHPLHFDLGDMMRGQRAIGDIRPLRRDVGGATTTPPGLAASVGGNPAMVQLLQAYSGLPTEQLQEMASRYPPNSSQGSMVQRSLRMRQMNPQSNPTQPTVPSGQPAQQQGGLGAAPQGFAAGGTPDPYAAWSEHGMPPSVPSEDALPSDSLDSSGTYNGDIRLNGGFAPRITVPSADQSFDLPQPGEIPAPRPSAVPWNSGAGNQSPAPVSRRVAGLAPSDENLPLPPDYVPPPNDSAPKTGGFATQQPPPPQTSGYKASPWETLLATGLSIMAGKSPHALENIGQGGMQGMQYMSQQRQLAAQDDLRRQQAEWQNDYRQSMVQNSANRNDNTLAIAQLRSADANARTQNAMQIAMMRVAAGHMSGAEAEKTYVQELQKQGYSLPDAIEAAKGFAGRSSRAQQGLDIRQGSADAQAQHLQWVMQHGDASLAEQQHAHEWAIAHGLTEEQIQQNNSAAMATGKLSPRVAPTSVPSRAAPAPSLQQPLADPLGIR